MLDTDTCSYVIKQRPESVLVTMQEKAQAGNDLYISAITYAELRLGAMRSGNPRKHNRLISEFCERLDAVHPWDSTAADHFARLQAALFAAGTPIGANDTMIAGHALSLRAIVVTNNQKHFSQVPKLKLENWA
ncbi:MAG: type II toxin-antitoxin system VapC family toxin [Gammaproteobacteria bacterium]|nr:MAG: type II toxin-antitoxin system VapC family toxin [Gammaproteobacteria bacterium]